MFERYTERARRTLFFARYEATLAGATAIEAHHLLLGLIRDLNGIIDDVFEHAGLSLADLHATIEARMTPPTQATGSTADIPFSDETKHVLAYAADEADRLLHDHIGPEHLLLGILRERGSLAESILVERGLRIATIREDIANLRHERQAASGARGYGAGLLPSEVRISSSTRPVHKGTSGNHGLDRWSLKGFCLRPLLSEVFDRHPPLRIDLPASLDDDRRYDVVMRFPNDPLQLGVAAAMQSAIEQHFNVVITRELRTVDACVLTAPGGDSAMTREPNSGGSGALSFSMEQIDGDDPPVTAEERRRAFEKRFHLIAPGDGQPMPAIGRISGSFSMSSFCSLLERSLGRIIIDETGLADASYWIDSGPDVDSTEEFFRVLREQFGLVMAPERRGVTMLVVRPTGDASNP